jgi:hypothetical protein
VLQDTKNPKGGLFGSDAIQVRSVSVSLLLCGRKTKGKIAFSCLILIELNGLH